ncbi:tetratricopeptide repeat protein [Paracoccus jiaweipingae]|uniref:tetratricopeptide repeat protein n=1 Tax=unclassified Paracoccus (in: a-proteobacteria) TaxID=2688777 RepID=UPI0037BB89D8
MTRTRFAHPIGLLVRLGLAGGAVVALTACNDPNFGMAETTTTSAAQRVGQLKAELRSRPNDTRVLAEIGRIYADQGFWTESMGAYREALIVTPGQRDLVLGYGRAQLALGDYAGALKSAQQAGGGDVDVLLLRAGALAGLGQLGKARGVLDAARGLNPRDLDVRSNIAVVAALSGDPQAYAIARAVAFAPDAQNRHIRNMILVGGITGMDGNARSDAEQRGMDPAEIGDILAVGRRARVQGMRAFTVLAS